MNFGGTDIQSLKRMRRKIPGRKWPLQSLGARRSRFCVADASEAEHRREGSRLGRRHAGPGLGPWAVWALEG